MERESKSHGCVRILENGTLTQQETQKALNLIFDAAPRAVVQTGPDGSLVDMDKIQDAALAQLYEYLSAVEKAAAPV